MSEPANQSQRARRRAHWVSLRTLQRVPNVVGETEAGEPIVEIGEARLVLPHGANHFYHLSPCSVCGKETITDAVLTTAHLAFQRHLYCQDCARLPAALEPLHPDERQAPTTDGPPDETPEPPVETPPEATERTPDPPPADDAPVSDATTSVSDDQDREPPLVSAVDQGPAPAPAATDEGDDAAWEALPSQLEEAVAERLEHSRQQSISELSAVVRENLDEERRAVAASVAATLAERVDENLRGLAAALTERFGEDLQAVATALDRRLDQQGRALTVLLDNRSGEQDLSTGVLDERLEKAVGQISSQVERTMTDRLELGERLEKAVGQISSQVEQIPAQVARAIAERLEKERNDAIDVMTAAVRETLDRTADDLATRLQGVPAARLDDQQREALTEQVVTALGRRLDEQRQAMVSDITAGLGGRLDEQRQAVVSEITGGLGGRMAEDLRRLAATLGGRFGEAQEVLVAQLKEASRGRRWRKGQEALPDGEPEAADGEIVPPAMMDELYERLDRVAAGAAEAGMLSARALLRATEEHVVATSSGLAAHVAGLQREVGDAREAITELRLVVDRIGRQVTGEKAARPAERKPAGSRTKPPAKKAVSGRAAPAREAPAPNKEGRAGRRPGPADSRAPRGTSR